MLKELIKEIDIKTSYHFEKFLESGAEDIGLYAHKYADKTYNYAKIVYAEASLKEKHQAEASLVEAGVLTVEGIKSTDDKNALDIIVEELGYWIIRNRVVTEIETSMADLGDAVDSQLARLNDEKQLLKDKLKTLDNRINDLCEIQKQRENKLTKVEYFQPN